jgi:hypothetical protein
MLKPRLVFPVVGMVIVVLLFIATGLQTSAVLTEAAIYVLGLAIAFVASLRLTHRRMLIAIAGAGVALLALLVDPREWFNLRYGAGWCMLVPILGSTIAIALHLSRRAAQPELR